MMESMHGTKTPISAFSPLLVVASSPTSIEANDSSSASLAEAAAESGSRTRQGEAPMLTWSSSPPVCVFGGGGGGSSHLLTCKQ